MPIEQVFRTVAVEDLAVPVSVWRFICDDCGLRQAFPDNPMPEGHSESDHTRAGWSIYYEDDDEKAHCPRCCAAHSEKVSAAMDKKDAQG